MKKIWLACIFLLAVACAGSDKPAQSGLVITAPDGFAVSCPTNYTRVSPHLCFAKTIFPEQWAETTTGCKTHALTTVPTNATLLILRIQPVINSSNLVNNKQLTTLFFTENTCTSTSTGFAQAYQREWVAVAAGTAIGAQPQITFVTPTNGNVFSNTTFTLTGINSSVTFDVMGYYD